MASKIRECEASDATRLAIDMASAIHEEVERLTARESNLKEMISTEARQQIADGEKSVRLVGKEAYAKVTFAEKTELEKSPIVVMKMEGLAASGILDGVIATKRKLTLAQENIERARQILSENGVTCTVEIEHELSIGEYDKARKAESSSAKREALESLSQHIKRSSIPRVAFERA